MANPSEHLAGAGDPREATAAQQARARAVMVRQQIEARGVHDVRVLEAMRTVPRHLFLAAEQVAQAHDDCPLPIGHGQTISQPYIVAAMAEAVELTGSERVLEVGSGSGYMAAVLSALALEVYGVELEPDLHRRSVQVLSRVGCSNVSLRCGDGAQGWPEQAPFDAIVLSCGTTGIPAEPWLQLAMGGRIILPMGAPSSQQELILVRKTPRGSRITRMMPVSFVPLRKGRDLPEVGPG